MLDRRNSTITARSFPRGRTGPRRPCTRRTVGPRRLSPPMERPKFEPRAPARPPRTCPSWEAAAPSSSGRSARSLSITAPGLGWRDRPPWSTPALVRVQDPERPPCSESGLAVPGYGGSLPPASMVRRRCGPATRDTLRRARRRRRSLRLIFRRGPRRPRRRQPRSARAPVARAAAAPAAGMEATAAAVISGTDGTARAMVVR